MFNKYRFGFDLSGLVLFLMVMLPNIIWFAVPASNDVLRNQSATPVVDAVASVCQVLTVACLCFVVNKGRPRLRLTPLVLSTLSCVAGYWLGWVLYYSGIVGAVVILLMTVLPCAAFILFAADRKNLPAAVFAIAFTVCHLIFAFVNFL